MGDPRKNQSDLFRVMSIATSLSFGVLAAVAVSMRSFGGGGGGFDVTWKSAVAFVVGVAAGWLFWTFIQRKVEGADKK